MTRDTRNCEPRKLTKNALAGETGMCSSLSRERLSPPSCSCIRRPVSHSSRNRAMTPSQTSMNTGGPTPGRNATPRTKAITAAATAEPMPITVTRTAMPPSSGLWRSQRRRESFQASRRIGQTIEVSRRVTGAATPRAGSQPEAPSSASSSQLRLARTSSVEPTLARKVSSSVLVCWIPRVVPGPRGGPGR